MIQKNVENHLTFDFGHLLKKEDNSVYSIIDLSDPDLDKYKITQYEEKLLNAWNEFYQGINEKVIGFPIWSFNFKSIGDDYNDLPEWKKTFVDRNRKLYLNNKKFIDKWLKKYNNLEDFIPTHRKFEWQAGNSINSIWEGIVQFRPSGIRVKKPDVYPALVAMVQIPIIGKYKRRLTPRECARLQSFPEDF